MTEVTVFILMDFTDDFELCLPMFPFSNNLSFYIGRKFGIGYTGH